MPPNSSFSTNSVPVSLLDEVHQLYLCLSSPVGNAIITAFASTSLLILLPLYAFVLYKGVQQWRQQHSRTPMSHSDVFTYHMVIVELLSVLGSLLMAVSVYTKCLWLTHTGIVLLSMNYIGQLLIHVLTCGERYLAVVYPITYLKLKKEKGIRIRNITIGCFWLLCLTWGATQPMHGKVSFDFTLLFLITLVFIFISMMNLSILWVLIRLGPRGEGGRRRQCDPSKLRLLFTTTAVLGVLLLKISWSISSIAVLDLEHIEEVTSCTLAISIIWINIPSSLVLPVLFLLKAKRSAVVDKVISH